MNHQELYDHLLNASYQDCLRIKRIAGPHSPYKTNQHLADLLATRIAKFEKHWGDEFDKCWTEGPQLPCEGK